MQCAGIEASTFSLCPYSPKCVERLSGKSRWAPKVATWAGIEGLRGRIFASQASDLASSRPLRLSFQTVSGRGILGSSAIGAVFATIGATALGGSVWEKEE